MIQETCRITALRTAGWTRWCWMTGIVALAVLGGCDGKNRFFFGDGSAEPLSRFPAAPSRDNVPDDSADGIAYSPPGTSVADVRAFIDREDNDAVMLFTTGTPTDDDDDPIPVNLWASYYANGVFGTPVEIVGEQQDDTSPVTLATSSVLFLNGVQNRDGDALILYKRRSSGTAIDRDGDGDPEDEGNTRLYSFYFDHSEAGRPASTATDGAPLTYGFTALATFVDADVNGDSEDEDQDVEAFGFVSDGLVYSAEFNDNESKSESGDDTTFAFAAFEIEGQLFYNGFDLQGTTTQFNPDGSIDLLATAVRNDLPGPLQSASGTAGNEFLTHNGVLLWSFMTSDLDSLEETFLYTNTFGPGGVGPTQLVSRNDTDVGQVVDPTFPDAKNFYGDDHGLPHYWFFYQEGGFDEGNTSTAVDVMVTRFDLSGRNPEVEEIDEFPADEDETPVVPGSLTTTLTCGTPQIFAAWTQAADTNGSSSVFVRAIFPDITTSVNDATSGDITQNNTATRINTDILDQPEESARNVIDFKFQTLGNGCCSTDGVFQSDPSRVSVLYTQELFDFGSGANVSDNRVGLFLGGLESGQAKTPMVQVMSDRRVDTIDIAWQSLCPNLLNLDHAEAVDIGGGNVGVYYLNQGNHKNLASAVGDNGSGNTVTATDALLLEIPLTIAGGPNFSPGTIIALDRLNNHNVVGDEPGCSFFHVHASGPFEGTRGIDIDGIGPYLEPVSRHPACGYGPLTTIQITVPGDGPFEPGNPFAAFKEVRLFFWHADLPDGGGMEISRDGDSVNSPDFFQVKNFKVVPTPVRQNSVAGSTPSFHNVFMCRHNSNAGSPIVLDYRRLGTGTLNFDPSKDQVPDRADHGLPVNVDHIHAATGGDAVDLYLQSGGHVYFNSMAAGANSFAGATIVDDDTPDPIRSSWLVDLQGGCNRDGTDANAGRGNLITIWVKNIGGVHRANVRVRTPITLE